MSLAVDLVDALDNARAGVSNAQGRVPLPPDENGRAVLDLVYATQQLVAAVDLLAGLWLGREVQRLREI